MSKITTHVLDTSLGRPASQVPVTLCLQENDSWRTLAKAQTNDDGRISAFSGMTEPLRAGIYRLSFALQEYFAAQNRPTFYPQAEITFFVENPAEHFHVPLLLSGFGYSTYRGS
ncbi:MAG: hydroxyisourate hydrolase [Oligoflexus sp.]